MDLKHEERRTMFEEGVSDTKLVQCIRDTMHDMSTRLITELSALSSTKKFLADSLIVNGRIYKPIADLEEITSLSMLKHLEGVDLKSMSDEKVDPETDELIDRLHGIMSLGEPCPRVQLLKDDFPMLEYKLKHLLIYLNHTHELVAELFKDKRFPMLDHKMKWLLISLSRRVYELVTELIEDGHPSHTLKKNVQVEQPKNVQVIDSKKVEDVCASIRNRYKESKQTMEFISRHAGSELENEIQQHAEETQQLEEEELELAVKNLELLAKIQRLELEMQKSEFEAKKHKFEYEEMTGN